MILDRKRILNVSLRVATLGTRFGFVFVLAKSLDAASVGYYGLFTATVGYALLCVGLDFYTFATREILRAPTEERGRMLKSQAALAGLFYLLLMPVAWLFLSRSGWPGHLAWWFLPILILEHLNQELYRLLIVLSEQVTASVLLFLRQGSWAIVVVVLMTWNLARRDLDTVMLLWGVADLLAVALGFWKLRQLRLGGWRKPVDWKWVRKGIGVSATFLTATLSVRAIQTADRYWLQDLAGIEVVGAYVLFFGVASALTVFLDAAVFSFKYPELITHHDKGEHALSRAKVQETLIHTLGFSAVFVVVSLVALPFLLSWIGKPVYIAQTYLYLWVLAAAVAYAVGLVPHYALYARGSDRPIVVSHIAALPVFAVSTWILSYLYTAAAVPIGVFIALAFVFFWKTFAYLKAVRSDDRQRLSAQL